jgi:hypothetical protein
MGAPPFQEPVSTSGPDCNEIADAPPREEKPDYYDLFDRSRPRRGASPHPNRQAHRHENSAWMRYLMNVQLMWLD